MCIRDSDLCFFENSYPADFPAQALEAAYAAMRVKRDWLDSIGVYFATDGTMEHREPIMARAWRQQELDPRPVE